MTTPLTDAFPAKPAAIPSLRDVVALTKPRITSFVVGTCAGGMWLAPGQMTRPAIAMTLVGTSLIVGGANALNMYLERDVDKKMTRTQNRPLPAGRMTARFALWFGVALSVVSVPILALGVNAATALLAVLANLSYVLAYTPLKQRSDLSLMVGAVPGAIPPLLGWTASTGAVGAGGLVLFGILFMWQVPHFLAITLFRREEYARAGLHVMPNDQGDRATRHAIVRWSLALVAVSLLLVPLKLAHTTYLVSASVLGATFFGWGCWGLGAEAGVRWAKSLFVVSLFYLVLLFAALGVDGGP